MAQTAKKTARKAEELAIEAQAPIEEEAQPVVKETHRVVRTWEARKPLAEDDDEEYEIEESAEEIESVSEFTDPIARLLHEIGASRSSWAMHVSRLPKYGRDERIDPKSRVFVGTLTIPDATYLEEAKYIEDIQARFAKGTETNHFLCCVRRDNRNYSYLPVVSVEPPDPLTAAKQQVENPGAPINYFTMPSADDGFKRFVQQAKQFAELRDLLFPQAMLEKIQPPAQSNEQLTTERALMHLVSQDQGMLDGIITKMLKPAGGQRETSWMELAFEAIKNDTLPKMIREAKSLLLETRAGVMPPQPDLLQSPGALNAPASAPAPMPAAPSTPPPAPSIQNLPPEVQLLNFAVQAHVQGWPAKAAADWISEFEEQNPSVQPYVTGFLSMDSIQALQWLTSTIPQAAHLAESAKAAEWIADLQAALKPEEDPA